MTDPTPDRAPADAPLTPKRPPHKTQKKIGFYFRKLRIAQLHVLGQNAAEIAEELGYTNPASVRNLLCDPEVRALIRDVQGASKQRLIEDLQFAQHVAFRTMLELAVDARDEKVRLAAAQHLSNMGGEPGKPTDRSESKSLALEGKEGAAAIVANALLDPGVRDILAKHPEVRALLERPSASSGSPEPDSGTGSGGPTPLQ